MHHRDLWSYQLPMGTEHNSPQLIKDLRVQNHDADAALLPNAER